MAGTLNVISFKEIELHLGSEEECLKFLSDQKWQEGFVCRHCGHTNYCRGKKPYSRRCTRCKKEESATAHTIFHGCRLPLKEAVHMAFRICREPGISTYELSRQFDTRQMTCWKLKKKIMDCIERNGELEILEHPVQSIPSSAKL